MGVRRRHHHHVELGLTKIISFERQDKVAVDNEWSTVLFLQGPWPQRLFLPFPFAPLLLALLE